jgi:hypothetical protein
VSIKDHVVLAPMASLDHLSGFRGPGKPSSSVTTLLNRSCLTSRWFSGERMRHQDDDWVERSLVAKTSSREQSPEFDLVGTSLMVVVRETPGVTRTTCRLGSFPYRVYIDSSHHDTLRYKWSLVCCSHLVVCLIVFDDMD